MKFTNKTIILLSPFLITSINVIIAVFFGKFIGKWAFIPIILLEWCLFLFFIFKFGGKDSITKWLQKPKGSFIWSLLSLLMGLITLPLFLMHYHTLNSWTVWLPWILIALINPWIEEFYYRGLLLDNMSDYKNWKGNIFTAVVFSMNHAVFGINSELNSGFAIIISTFVMGNYLGYSV